MMTNASQLAGFTTNDTVSTNFDFAPAGPATGFLRRAECFQQRSVRAGLVAGKPACGDFSDGHHHPAGKPGAVKWRDGGLQRGGVRSRPIYIPMAVQWRESLGRDLPHADIDKYPAIRSGAYALVVSAPSGAVTSSNAILTVLPPPSGGLTNQTARPTITTQPGSQTVFAGSTVFLSVLASGDAPLTCQWKRNGANLSDGGNYSGSASATLVIADTQTNNAGNYTVTVSDSSGSVKSAAAVLHVGALVTVQTNGPGVVAPDYNGRILPLGTRCEMTARPRPGAMFAGWSGGINTNTAAVKFTVESNLALEARFVPNPFLAARGNYQGLFAPASAARTQANSGAFNLNVTGTGAMSGKLLIGSETVRLGKNFDLTGYARIISTRQGRSALTTSLQLDFGNQSITGTVTDGEFHGAIVRRAGPLQLRPKDDQLRRPLHPHHSRRHQCNQWPLWQQLRDGDGQCDGQHHLCRSLADGTSVSQTSVVSADGAWPLYLPLYGGNGSLWSSNYFLNGAITSATNASWISTSNPARSALFQAGFTNDEVTIVSSAYNPDSTPLLALTNGQAILDGGNLPAITDQITLASDDVITVTDAAENTNKLALRINKSTGVIRGTFASPSSSRQTIKVNGVLLQNGANAAGYFLGADQSGAFMLSPR